MALVPPVRVGHCVDQYRYTLDLQLVIRCTIRDCASSTHAMAKLQLVVVGEGIQQEFGRIGTSAYEHVSSAILAAISSLGTNA